MKRLIIGLVLAALVFVIAICGMNLAHSQANDTSGVQLASFHAWSV